MATIYLSPSVQEGNPYITGENEEYVMNLIADAMEPYLVSSGIQFVRNTPDQTLSQVIAQSNAGRYDLHLALHSNAAPDNKSGQVRGTDVYYYTTSREGKRAADIIANNFKYISPTPERVKTVPTTSLAELRRTKAPAVLVEIAYHDNRQDAQWILDNITPIARNLVQSVAEFFGIPFIEATAPQIETVQTPGGGGVNLRYKPSYDAAVVTVIPNGATVTVVGEWNDWYVLQYQGYVGYVDSAFVSP